MPTTVGCFADEAVRSDQALYYSLQEDFLSRNMKCLPPYKWRGQLTFLGEEKESYQRGDSSSRKERTDFSSCCLTDCWKDREMIYQVVALID